MSITPEKMIAWCEMLIAGSQYAPKVTLQDYLEAIPKLQELSDLPAGTPVLIRGDVDAKPGSKVGEGDIRLRSMLSTLKFGRERGWKQIIFGHIGRDPELSLNKVAARFGELLEMEIPLLDNWVTSDGLVCPEVAKKIADSPNGSIVVLENTRKYDIERVLWKANSSDVPGLSGPLASFVTSCAERLAKVYINEGFSAGSLDTSSTVVPAAMSQVALGDYLTEQFTGPMMECMKTELVVFSGIKIDKLDDLEAMIARGNIKIVLAAGSLAMALKKGIAEIDGKECCLGLAEDPAHSDKPYYIPRERIDQAKAMVATGRQHGVEFVVPVDSVTEDGTIVETLKPTDQQFDIGPKSSALFEDKIGQFLASTGRNGVAFHNGVFGMFEDPRFEEGTRRFIPQLKRMKDAGIAVYVGGGEGGKALKKYGSEDWVTHVFTAGGTVLNALGSEPVPYLVALKGAVDSQS